MTYDIHITFWKKENKTDSKEIFSFTTTTNPNYVKGQKLFLEFTCYPQVPEKFKKDNMRLTSFKIIDIHQFIHQTLSDQPTIENFGDDTYTIPFSFHTHPYMDIFVKEIYKYSIWYRLKMYVNKLKKGIWQ